jgi:hypothetical protein
MMNMIFKLKNVEDCIVEEPEPDHFGGAGGGTLCSSVSDSWSGRYSKMKLFLSYTVQCTSNHNS